MFKVHVFSTCKKTRPQAEPTSLNRHWGCTRLPLTGDKNLHSDLCSVTVCDTCLCPKPIERNSDLPLLEWLQFWLNYSFIFSIDISANLEPGWPDESWP